MPEKAPKKFGSLPLPLCSSKQGKGGQGGRYKPRKKGIDMTTASLRITKAFGFHSVLRVNISPGIIISLISGKYLNRPYLNLLCFRPFSCSPYWSEKWEGLLAA